MINVFSVRWDNMVRVRRTKSQRRYAVYVRLGLGQDVDDECVLRQVGQRGTCAPD
jgi:hypothetical protein